MKGCGILYYIVLSIIMYEIYYCASEIEREEGRSSDDEELDSGGKGEQRIMF